MSEIYEYKKRRLHLYSKDHKIFMARLFDERRGGQETDTIYFCDFENWKEFVKIKQSKQNGEQTPASGSCGTSCSCIQLSIEEEMLLISAIAEK